MFGRTRRLPVISVLWLISAITIIITTAVFLPFNRVAAAPANQIHPEKEFFFQTSLFTHHWGVEDNLNANNKQQLINLEYHPADSRLYGIARFLNSFNQISYYLYTGKSYNLAQGPGFVLKAKLTYGIIHGYDDENGRYNKIYNILGTFPAFIPIIGIKIGDFEIGLLPFSIEGVMAAAGFWF